MAGSERRSIERAAGRVLMVGLPGPDLDPETERRLTALGPGGVILFRRNLQRPDRLAELAGAVVERLEPPSLFAIDQEGGRVSRLAGWLGPTPTAGELAAAGRPAVLDFGAATGNGLRALGFNLDFAPVVDLCSPQATNGIGDRSFGTDPMRTTELAGAFLDALQAAAVAGCLKHFPGLGDTAVDSHLELPRCERSAGRLEDEDLAPYRALLPRAASVMVGHAAYPTLDPAGGPASLSHRIVDGWLRQRLGYSGLVVSDDLEMGAVAPRDAQGAAAVAAIEAGCDLLLYCSDLERAAVAREALIAAAADPARPAFGARLAGAARAVGRTAGRWPAAAPDLGAWWRAAERVARIARKVSRAGGR